LDEILTDDKENYEYVKKGDILGITMNIVSVSQPFVPSHGEGWAVRIKAMTEEGKGITFFTSHGSALADPKFIGIDVELGKKMSREGYEYYVFLPPQPNQERL
jgi:hypothetical protein